MNGNTAIFSLLEKDIDGEEKIQPYLLTQGIARSASGQSKPVAGHL